MHFVAFHHWLDCHLFCIHGLVRPVQSVAHLDGDQHRQSHGHWRSSLKHLAVDPSKVLVVLAALHEVWLTGTIETWFSHSDKRKSLHDVCLWACVVVLFKIFDLHQLNGIHCVIGSNKGKYWPAGEKWRMGRPHCTGTTRQQLRQLQHRHNLENNTPCWIGSHSCKDGMLFFCTFFWSMIFTAKQQ